MKVLTIARLTLREALRKRMIWGVLALSLLFIVLYYWGFTLVKADFDATAARRAQSGAGDRGEIINFAFVSTILVGTVVAVVSGLGKLKDPWSDLVNWGRELSVDSVKYRLFADAVSRQTLATA